MKTQLKPWMLAGALILTAPCVSHAQETLGSLGAAGAVGATLGAAGAGGLSSSRITRGVGSGSSSEMGMEGGSGATGSPGATGGAGTSTERDVLGNLKGEAIPVAPLPRVQTFNGSGRDFVRQLFAFGPPPSAPSAIGRSTGKRKLSPRAIASLTKAQRTKLVQSKYKIPPRGWLAAYLPQDRYKLGKDWRFVSTEDDHVYYTPAAMAARLFNPNRVIGFSSWREAMLAGYQPDPRSKPAPAPAIISYANALSSRLAVPASDLPEQSPDVQSFYDFVELIYAGQVDEEVTYQTLGYAKSVFDTMAYIPTTRWEAKRASVVALETALFQRPITDLPLVAGSRAFETRIADQKEQIGKAVEANNDKINALAYPLAEDLAYRPGTVGRQVYETMKARYEAEFETPYRDAEVEGWLPYAINKVEAQTGLHRRNASSEIIAMEMKEAAKAISVNPYKRSKSQSGSGGISYGRTTFVTGGNWISHYLPADRSRITGGIWRYVSTDLDTQVYLPNDARMLRQPASRVIGFNNIDSAIEAGYKPAEGGGIDLSVELASARRDAKAAILKRKQKADASKTAGAQGGQAGSSSQSSPARSQ